MTRSVVCGLLIASFAAGCAAARAPEAAAGTPRVYPDAPPKKPGEYERILGTFSARGETPIYLIPTVLERGYDDEDDDEGESALFNMAQTFQRLGHKRGEAAARLNRGAVLWHRGEGDAAYRELESAKILFAAAGDLDGEAHAHEWLGFFMRESGEKELAEDHLALAYQMFKKLENEVAAERILSYGE